MILDYRLHLLSVGKQKMTAAERAALRAELESYLDADLPEDRDGSRLQRRDAALASAVIHYRRLLTGSLG